MMNDEKNDIKINLSDSSINKTFHECNQCDYRVTRKKTLKIHIQYEHEGADFRYRCDRCGKLFKYKEPLKDHIRLDHDKATLKCNEPGCDKVYLSRGGLRDHKYQVHVGREFSCTECDFKAYKKCIVNDHIKNKHMKIELKCEHESCYYVTSSKRNLRNHYNRIHKDLPQSNPKRRADQLKMHKEDKHEGKNQCNECKRTYHNSYYLKKHKCIKMALETSNIKMESDNEIDMKYVSPIILKYPCPFCSDEYPTTQEMNSHLLSHDISK